jgi:N-methylhydantoinase A
LASVTIQALDAWFQDMEQQALGALSAAELKTRKIVLQRSLDMRYVGQEHAVTVEVPAAAFKQGKMALLKKAFDEAHRERYGRGSPHEAAEIVSIRSTLNGEMKKPALEKIAPGKRTPPAGALSGTRKVYYSEGGWAMAQVYRRDALLAGNTVHGPALIEEHASTTVLQPKDVMVVDPLGNLHITIGLS